MGSVVVFGAAGRLGRRVSVEAAGRDHHVIGVIRGTPSTVLGLLLGWVSWSALSTGVILGWVVALVTLVVWHPGRRPGRFAAIPAGPCLWLGALVAVLATR